MERDFKGVWIPKAVWLDERLNALDKVILTEIDSLDQGSRGCYASNKHIAEFCQCSETKVSTAISKLVKLGYLTIQSFDGRKRELKSSLSKFERQTFKNCKADLQNLKESNTYNNTVNNTDKINKKVILEEFERIWKEYPRKQGKEKALQAYIRARKADIGEFNEFVALDGIRRYKTYLEANKTDPKYIKQGSTWFNQKCWEDEYTIEPGMAAKKPINNDFDYLEEMEEERTKKALKLYGKEGK